MVAFILLGENEEFRSKNQIFIIKIKINYVPIVLKYKQSCLISSSLKPSL